MARRLTEQQLRERLTLYFDVSGRLQDAVVEQTRRLGRFPTPRYTIKHFRRGDSFVLKVRDSR